MKKQTAFSTNRCYCLISHFPFFESHFSVLYAIIAAERHNSILQCTQDLSDFTDSLNNDKEEKKGELNIKLSRSDDPCSSTSPPPTHNPSTPPHKPTSPQAFLSAPAGKGGKGGGGGREGGKNSSLSRSIIRSYYTVSVPPVGKSESVTLPGEIPCNLSFSAEKEDGLLGCWLLGCRGLILILFHFHSFPFIFINSNSFSPLPLPLSPF